MTDLVARLARKHCLRHSKDWENNECSCGAATAAIREALEEAEKVVQSIYIREHNAVPDDKHDGQEVAREIIAIIQSLERGGGTG